MSVFRMGQAAIRPALKRFRNIVPGPLVSLCLQIPIKYSIISDYCTYQ